MGMPTVILKGSACSFAILTPAVKGCTLLCGYHEGFIFIYTLIPYYAYSAMVLPFYGLGYVRKLITFHQSFSPGHPQPSTYGQIYGVCVSRDGGWTTIEHSSSDTSARQKVICEKASRYPFITVPLWFQTKQVPLEVRYFSWNRIKLSSEDFYSFSISQWLI